MDAAPDACAEQLRDRDTLLGIGDTVASLSVQQHCPQRTCVGCRSRADRSQLLRVVAEQVAGQWVAVPDPPMRAPGRGAWVHFDPECVRQAQRRGWFARALRRGAVLDSQQVMQYVTAVRTDNASRDGSGTDCDEHPMSTQQ